MSMFFKALEQAERDGNGRQHERSSRAALPPDVPGAAGAVVETISPPPASMAPEFEIAAGPVARPVRTADAARVTAAPHAAVSAPAAAVTAPGEIDEHLVSLLDPSSFPAEQYRALRHSVEQLHRIAGHSIVAIGSPSASDGKTTTALNLAGALGQAPEARVLVIEADLRCPKMAERLGLDGSQLPGLVEAIDAPHLGIADVARKLTTYNLSVVLAGRCPVTPYEALQSPRLGELLDEARQSYDYVVIDTPPIVAFPDCRIIGRWVDGWLIVVAAHRTSRKLLEEALDLMEEKKTIGFVFTHDERFRSGGRYYGGYYGARSGRAAKAPGR